MPLENQLFKIIPCTSNVEFVYPMEFDDSIGVHIERVPIIAWKVVYDEAANDEDFSYAIPISFELLPSQDEGAFYYPDTEYWYFADGFSDVGFETLSEILKENFLKKNMQK